MKTYIIETHERFLCAYIVDANSPEEALTKFKNGGCDYAAPPEFYEIVSIRDPVEINDEDEDYSPR